MLRIVTYDITDNTPRTKTADCLERHGFTRLQYSVFAGDIPANRWKKIWSELNKIYIEKCSSQDLIYSIVINADAFKDMLSLGTRPDISYILNEQNTLYI